MHDKMKNGVRNSLGSLVIILISPVFVMFMWYTNTALNGSIHRLFNLFYSQGFWDTLYSIWRPIMFGSPIAWLILGGFAVFELLLMKILPGPVFSGPITPKGHIPAYKANGVGAYFATLIVFCLCTFGLKLFSASIIYDNLGALLGALNLSSLIICLLLYLKGRFYPSSTDCDITGNFIFDYYWGTELYPVVWGWNIKHFINCRFGMMSWGLILLSYASKQYELYGLSNSMLISVALQLIYITKFFIWETGYLCSLDVMHDRAGFYTSWGCLVWVPCIYTSPSMYLVLHPVHLNDMLAFLIFMVGSMSILINFMADRQRQMVRATVGQCNIWGKKPVILRATYKTLQGDKKENILLASGWWGLARHFHYVPEIIGALCWTLPALFENVTPYFYVCFLTILLVHRAFRDEKRCVEKYGADWKIYCERVPYKIIPFLV